LESYYRYEFASPVKINAGHRALDHLPFELRAFNAVKPLVVTNKDLTGRGVVSTVVDAFKDSEMAVGIFDAVPQEPDAKLIRDLAGLYRDKGFDAVVGLGGGVIADTAKVLNVVVSAGPAYLAEAAGEDRVPGPLKPFFLLPSGAWDGREMSRFAELGGREYASPQLMPDLAVLDPRLMIAEPLAVTAASVLATLAQAVDAEFGPERNPLTGAYAAGALSIVRRHLDAILANSGDRSALLALANAACFAGFAFSNVRPGMAYRLGRAVALAGRLSPGFSMGAVLPHVLAYYRSRYGGTETALPLSGGSGVSSGSQGCSGAEAVDAVKEVLKKILKAGAGYNSLKEAGFPESALSETAGKAAVARESRDDCLDILKKAFDGATEP
jgi:alcohol dehydrogenase